jgi:hypothetical protein
MTEREVDILSIHPHPQAVLIPEMQKDEWDDFYRDIVFRGIKVPIEITADGVILDGRHRYRAACQLGLTKVPVTDAVLGNDDLLTYMVRAAVLRRHLSDDQRAVIAVYWKEGHKQYVPGPGRGHIEVQEERSDTRVSDLYHPAETKASEQFNVPPNAIKKATYVAKRNPELAQQFHAGEKPLNVAWREVKHQEDRQS